MINRQTAKTAITASSLALAVGGLAVGGSTTAQAATPLHIQETCEKNIVNDGSTGWVTCNKQGKWNMTVWCNMGLHYESSVMEGPGTVQESCPWPQKVNAISIT